MLQRASSAKSVLILSGATGGDKGSDKGGGLQVDAKQEGESQVVAGSLLSAATLHGPPLPAAPTAHASELAMSVIERVTRSVSRQRLKLS